MLQQIGSFIGMALADIVNLFRGRQAVPCLVDWDEEPDGDPDVSGVFVKPYGQRPDVRAVFKRPVQQYAVRLGPANTSSAPTVAELNAMQEAKGFTYPEFQFTPYTDTTPEHRDNPDTVRMFADEDCCPDYEVDCCLETDTIGEAQGKA